MYSVLGTSACFATGRDAKTQIMAQSTNKQTTMSYLNNRFTLKPHVIHLVGNTELDFGNTVVTIIHVWPVNEPHH